MAAAGVAQPRVLLVCGGLRNAGHRGGHRGDRVPPREPLRRKQTRGRVAHPRPGHRHGILRLHRSPPRACATSTWWDPGHRRSTTSRPHNLFPKVFATLLRGEPARINGADYDTPDGTCVRDYVHVVDLANAHVEAARALDEGRPLEPVYNLGSGAGTSVREIVDAMRDVTGIDTDPAHRPAPSGRPGAHRRRRRPRDARPQVENPLHDRADGADRVGGHAPPLDQRRIAPHAIAPPMRAPAVLDEGA